MLLGILLDIPQGKMGHIIAVPGGTETSLRMRIFKFYNSNPNWSWIALL